MRDHSSHDSFTGITEHLHYENGDVIVESTQDCEDILDANERDRSNPDLWKQGVKDSVVHYARIPAVVQLEWLKTYGQEGDPMKPENRKLLLKLLASREWGYLRLTSKIHI